MGVQGAHKARLRAFPRPAGGNFLDNLIRRTATDKDGGQNTDTEEAFFISITRPQGPKSDGGCWL